MTTGCLVSCSTSGPGGHRLDPSGSSVGSVSSGSGDTGTVRMHLFIGGGASIDSLQWMLSNGSNIFNGTVLLTDDAGNAAQSIEFVLGNAPVGSGYVVTLSGADSLGDPCTGSSAPVTVDTGTTVDASVLVTCTVPTDASLSQAVDSGTVAVDATVSVVSQPPFGCPSIQGISVSPAELRPPETANLTSVVIPASGGTQTLQWSATCASGTPVITNPTQANATFSCGTALGSSCTITLTVDLLGTGLDGGSVGAVCTGAPNTSVSESIACETQ